MPAAVVNQDKETPIVNKFINILTVEIKANSIHSGMMRIRIIRENNIQTKVAVIVSKVMDTTTMVLLKGDILDNHMVEEIRRMKVRITQIMKMMVLSTHQIPKVPINLKIVKAQTIVKKTQVMRMKKPMSKILHHHHKTLPLPQHKRLIHKIVWLFIQNAVLKEISLIYATMNPHYQRRDGHITLNPYIFRRVGRYPFTIKKILMEENMIYRKVLYV